MDFEMALSSAEAQTDYITKLPTALKAHIFDNLELKNAKKLRLAGKVWAEAGSQSTYCFPSNRRALCLWLSTTLASGVAVTLERAVP
jgi:hypothetical protein